MHEPLEEANERYPHLGLAVMPAGRNHGRERMDDGMILPPIPLPADATRPTKAGIWASQRGDYSISCLEYCGYGHSFIDVDGSFVVG